MPTLLLGMGLTQPLKPNVASLLGARSSQMPNTKAIERLGDQEICLIKGLSVQGVSQQEIIARFSFPQRTVHHNLVSAIVRRLILGNDIAYPPASAAQIDLFVQLTDRSPSSYEGHRRAVSIAMADHKMLIAHEFAYRYHPVGQGMFCSGWFTRSNGERFHWVYDCGTDKGNDGVRREHVVREIDALKKEFSGDNLPHLDLVVLSHFDTDHLSGILDLIDNFTVGTLLLPHLTPWYRMIIALIEDAAIDSDLLHFLLEPTAFLLDRADGRIGRILLVPSSGDGPALPPVLPPDPRPPEEGEHERTYGEIFQEGEHSGEEGGAGPDSGLLKGEVQFLERGGSITIDHAWEFVPYNDARLSVLATHDFVSQARLLAAQINRSMPLNVRMKALDELKDLYETTFKTPSAKKSTARQRNEISLFLYSGPIGSVQILGALEIIPRHRLDPLCIKNPHYLHSEDRFGQMFTGDGYLQTDRQWNDFQAFFGAHDRLRRAGIFQVMHHGSKANWRREVAGTVQPVTSVFCSDPAHHNGHPDWDVLETFQDYNPRQVDLFHGWGLRGAFRFG